MDNRRELFSAYNGRYVFDVDKAYDLIEKDKVKSEVIKMNSRLAQSFVFFTWIEDTHLQSKISSDDSIDGLLVKFSDPEHPDDMMIIDGNHRVTAKINANYPMVNLIYIKNPSDTKKFLKINKKIPKDLFPDEDSFTEKLLSYQQFKNLLEKENLIKKFSS